MSTLTFAGKTSGVSKITAEKNQRIVLELVSQPGNDQCADCKAKAPRWASHNLGIFLCVRCASIHRKIGTHVTKVKSLTLDDWSKEQVENMKKIGNIRANAYWNPDESKHPLPTNMEGSERDSELEKFIRSKYEFQRFRSKSTLVAEKLGPSQSLQSRTPMPSSRSTAIQPPARSRTAPIRSEPEQASLSMQPPVPSAPSLGTRSVSSGTGIEVPPRRSSFNPFPSSGSISSISPASMAALSSASPGNHQASLTKSTFDDLVSLQAPSMSSSFPLQYAQSPDRQFPSQQFPSPMTTGPIQVQNTQFSSSPFGTPTSGAANPYANLSNATGSPFSSPNSASNFRSASLPVSTFGQSPLGPMPTGSPGAFQQPFNPPPNPFTQMQMQMQSQAQMQQFPPGTLLANGNTTPGQPSPFFSPQAQAQQQQQSQQQQAFQQPGAFETPYTTQAQQAQQIFQSMAGTGSANNPFAQWRG